MSLRGCFVRAENGVPEYFVVEVSQFGHLWGKQFVVTELVSIWDWDSEVTWAQVASVMRRMDRELLEYSGWVDRRRTWRATPGLWPLAAAA